MAGVKNLMKKIHTETEIKTIEIVDDVICNKCGVSCRDSCDMNFEGIIELSICGGYASKLGDSVQYTFSVCENCLKNFFSTFTIPPNTKDYF